MTYSPPLPSEMPQTANTANTANTQSSLRDFNQPPASSEISGRDLIVLGAAIAHFGWGLNEDVLTALSWALLNRRIQYSGQHCGQDIGQNLDGSLSAVESWATALLSDPLEHETARALAVFTQVLAGGIEDPTGGACRFHCHDETPKWADHMDIRAIVGPYLFYAPKSNDEEKSR